MDKLISWTPFGNARMPWVTLFSYIFDYAIIIILAIIYAALDKLITPFNQRFSLTDIRIQYPYAEKERITIAQAIIIACAVPLVVIAVYTLVIDGIFSHHKQAGRKVWTFKDRLWELNCGILGLFLAHGTAFCITGSLKNLIGRPRPDLIDRCDVPPGSTDAPGFGLTASSICRQTTKAIMQDGFRSFPSGHASAAFAGLFFLSLYLAGKLHILDQRGEVWRTVIVVTPTVAASAIAASRIMDSRHHYTDVLFGAILGLLCGWGSYRQYFPPLSHSWLKGRAYPMRDWGVAVKTPTNAQYTDYRNTVGRHDRTAGIVLERDTEEYAAYPPSHPYHFQQPNESSYGLEPMRPRLPPRPIASPGFENTSVMTTDSLDEAEYEHVRPKVASFPRQQEPTKGTGDISDGNIVMMSNKGRTPSGNLFRDQVAANHVRREDEIDDKNFSRPSHHGVPGMGNPI